jgi:hypothetical protein
MKKYTSLFQLFFLYSATSPVAAFHPSSLTHSTILDRYNTHVRIRNNPVVVVLSSSTITTDNLDNEDAMIVDVDYQTEQWNSAMKKSNVISIAQELRNKYGYLLNPLVVPRNQQSELFDAILELEDDFINPNTGLTTTITRDDVLTMLPGDWDLICTIPILPMGSQKLPFEIPSLFENEFIQNLFPSSLPIASLTNKFVTVTQRIRTLNDETNNNSINRVDHVIEVKPPNQISDIIANSNSNGDTTPSWLSNLNINPLEVKESKVILIHNAEVVDDEMVEKDDTSFSMSNNMDDKRVKLRLKLQSVVNNIAGTGANLNPNGADIVSVNVPQIDVLSQNTELNDALGGSFITTYIDDEFRISRSDILSWNFNNDKNNQKNKLLQIRIFQKRRTTRPSMDTSEEGIADVDDIAIEAPSDVEE